MEKSEYEITAPKFVEEPINGKTVTLYVISITVKSNTWEIKKRYSELSDLVKLLKPSHGNLPPFPKKTMFKLKKYADKEKRRAGIEAFFSGIIDRDDIRSNSDFCEFIEVPKK